MQHARVKGYAQTNMHCYCSSSLLCEHIFTFVLCSSFFERIVANILVSGIQDTSDQVFRNLDRPLQEYNHEYGCYTRYSFCDCRKQPFKVDVSGKKHVHIIIVLG
ncbi:hypothetical protein ACJX0J_029930, partial [Zea mays]